MSISLDINAILPWESLYYFKTDSLHVLQQERLKVVGLRKITEFSAMVILVLYTLSKYLSTISSRQFAQTVFPKRVGDAIPCGEADGDERELESTSKTSSGIPWMKTEFRFRLVFTKLPSNTMANFTQVYLVNTTLA